MVAQVVVVVVVERIPTAQTARQARMARTEAAAAPEGPDPMPEALAAALAGTHPAQRLAAPVALVVQVDPERLVRLGNPARKARTGRRERRLSLRRIRPPPLDAKRPIPRAAASSASQARRPIRRPEGMCCSLKSG